MAVRINVIITIDNLLKTIKPLLTRHDIHVYINKYDKEKGLYYTEYDEHKKIGNDVQYHKLFFVSKKIDVKDLKSLYDDELSVFCLECEGGRYNELEIEMIQLRIVSKTPDKNIKSFSAAVNNFFKKDSNFGIGILPLDNSINKNTFYYKSDIQNRIIWREFKRKEFLKPIKVAE